MNNARTMPVTQRITAVRNAAAAQDRIRIRGVVTDSGTEWGSRYRSTWVRIATCGTAVRLTASPTSRLGRAEPGAKVDVAVVLTGMLDVTNSTYYGSNAYLISLD